MPSFPQLREPLSDGSVTLRPSAERDIPEILIAYQDDPGLHLRLGMEKPPSGADLGRRSERAEDDRTSGRAVTLTILEPASDICRGEVNIHHVEWDHQRAELGIWIALGARGKGLARGALRLAAEWLVNDCGFARVELLTEPDNEAMIRAGLAAGFVREGTLRSYLMEHGVRIDVAVLSLISSDLGT
jgi:[ribosomal protein S5]-alanine N-acetyltransferase